MEPRKAFAIEARSRGENMCCRMLRVVIDQAIDFVTPPLQAGVGNIVIRALRRFANLRVDHIQGGDHVAIRRLGVEQREVAHRACRRGPIHEGVVERGNRSDHRNHREHESDDRENKATNAPDAVSVLCSMCSLRLLLMS